LISRDVTTNGNQIVFVNLSDVYSQFTIGICSFLMVSMDTSDCQINAASVCEIASVPTIVTSAMHIPKRKNFGELRGLAVLCNLSIEAMTLLLGISNEELALWTSGETMVPRYLVRTATLYAVANSENITAVDEIHRTVIEAQAPPHLSGADSSLAYLLIEAGFSVDTESADGFADVFGVPVRTLRRWLRGEEDPPRCLYVFLTLLSLFDVARRYELIQAVALVSRASIKNPANRDAELRLGMAACRLSQFDLASLLGCPESTLLDWFKGERQIPRDIWKILELHLIATPFALDYLKEQTAEAPPLLRGSDGSLLTAIGRAGFQVQDYEVLDMPRLAEFLDCCPSVIEGWLADLEPAPPHLWALFALLANVNPKQRVDYIDAFVDERAQPAKATDAQISIPRPSQPVRVHRPQNESLH